MNEDEAAGPRGWLFACLGLLITAAVYAPTLGAPFVWDDLLLIAESPRVRSLDWGATFLRPFWLGTVGVDATNVYFRPLSTLSYQLDFKLHADNPAGYHLTNVAWHLLASALLFALLRRRGGSVALSFVLMLLWSLSPRLTEATAWVSGRTDVLCAVFVLLALLVHRPGSLPRLAVAAGFAFAALLSKEAGVAALVALGLLELGGGSVERARRAALGWRLAVLAAPLLAYAALRFVAGALTPGDGLSLSVGGRALAVLEALGRYAFMLVNPLQPRSLMGQLLAPTWPFVIAGAGVVVLGALALRRWGKPSYETLAFASLAAVPLAMVLHFVALPVSVVAADRYLYLPLAGVLLASVPALSAVLARQPRLMLAPLALVVACGARTASRVADYTDTTRFWLAAAEHAPTHAEAISSLGSIAYRAGLWDEAFALYARAANLPGNRSLVSLDNAALVAMMQGERALAAELGDELVRRKSDASYNLRRGTIAFNSLELDEAQRYAERCLTLNPRMELGRELLRLILQTKALRSADQATPAELLLLDVRALRYPEVVAALREADAAQRLDPVSIRRALGFVIAKGRPEDARDLLTRYRSLLPEADVQRMVAGVALRLQTAQEARPQLRGFLSQER